MLRTMSALPLTAEQEAEAQALFTRFKRVFEQEAWQMARWLAGREDRQLLGDGVRAPGARTSAGGAGGRERATGAKKKGYRGARIGCPHCRESARYVSERSKGMVRLLGPVRFERAYYHCAACGQGRCPWEGELGVTEATVSPAAAEVACIAGVQTSFAEASEKVLPKLAGLRLAESTVERSTEAAGERLAAAQASGQASAPAQAWAWHRDREGKTVAYIAVEATGVAQQGATGAKAEGRRANVAVRYNPVPDDPVQWADPAVGREPSVASALSGELGAHGHRRCAASAAGRRGGDGARRALDCAGGGRQRVGGDAARAVSAGRGRNSGFLSCGGISERAGQELAGERSAGGGSVRAARVSSAQTRRGRGGVGDVTRVGPARALGGRLASYHATVRYVENQVHRMDYPLYRAKGWQIGCGPVESACKRVVGQRLNGAGMRWGEAGSDAVCHLRALFLSESGPWEAFWHHN